MSEQIGELLVWARAMRSEPADAEVPGRPIPPCAACRADEADELACKPDSVYWAFVMIGCVGGAE
jgi:hypothetical protein